MHDRAAETSPDGADPARSLADLVFVGFNKQVIALDRYTGEIAWAWKAPEGTGFVTVFLDGDRLIAAVNGYIFCLDPIFGQEVWRNPMKGRGLGVTSVASLNGAAPSAAAAVTEQQKKAAAAAAAG